MERNDIIMALEHCINWNKETGCEGCPYDADCYESQILEDSLSLIKQLTEENERLRAATPECVEKVYRFMLRYVDKLSEIDEIDITIRLGQIAKEMLEGEK